MAILLGKICDFPVLLCSATPSVETYYNAVRGKYLMVKLKSRFGKGVMPQIDLIDINKENIPKGGNISQVMRDKILATIMAKKQVLVFINRRGYYRMMSCRECGYVYDCENCDNKLVYHKKDHLLKCHYCGYCLKPQDICKKCSKPTELITRGRAGIERITEELQEITGNKVKIAVISSDSIGNSDEAKKTLGDVTEGNVDIIVGTQIVAKGHNFPHLALVAALDVDISAISGDLRIFEKTYQLLVQVAGRAGRFDDGGRVIIQTYEPSHPVLQAMLSGIEDHFYKEELLRRKKANLPPFSRQISIIISASEPQEAYDLSKTLHQIIEEQKKLNHANASVLILGPVESILHYLKRQYRYRITLQSANNAAMREIIENALTIVNNSSIYKKAKNSSIKIDVDPISVL
jgi:primosomal protein N' (replication factor Y)